ncbi:hypothetical protein [Duffyella gerundensis]|uniref:hypothetical protein n=1 Tax=Duffyella TaxID=3026546 RepID=UPI003F6E03C4
MPSSLITEVVTSFGSDRASLCFPGWLQRCQAIDDAVNVARDIMTQPHDAVSPAGIIILPVNLQHLHWISAIASEMAAASLRVNFAVNYQHLHHQPQQLQQLVQAHSFWLYDFAERETDWDQIKAFPFTGVVINHAFFADNYRKFSFPYLLEHFRDQQAEVIIRSRELPLNQVDCAALNLTGWQQQVADTLFN